MWYWWDWKSLGQTVKFEIIGRSHILLLLFDTSLFTIFDSRWDTRQEHTLPFAIHGRHFFPGASDRVEPSARVEILESVETANDVDVLAYNDGAVVRARPIRVLVWHAFPPVRLGVVRLDDGGWATTTPATDGKQHLRRVPGPGQHWCDRVAHAGRQLQVIQELERLDDIRPAVSPILHIPVVLNLWHDCGS